MTAPNSAIAAAAITCCPQSVSIWFASLSGTMMTLSEVATKMIARSSGVLISPTECRRRAAPRPSANEIAKPTSEVASRAPRSRSTWISRPARNSRQARPTVEKTSTGVVSEARPSP